MQQLKQKATTKLKMKPEMIIFFILIAIVAFGNGLSDSILSNYFKDAYDVTATQRAFIEFPRELPGVLCVIVIGLLSFIGDMRVALIAQICSCVGIMVLGFFTPSFAIMLIFLFIYSMGMHLFMPLSDGIGMQLAEKDQIGKRIGQYGSVKTGIGFLTGFFVFVMFRYEIFSFTTPIKWAFVLSAACFAVAIVLAIMLVKKSAPAKTKFTSPKKIFIFRKEYKYYYFLTVLHGVQKQIAYVFGSWVIIDLLLKGADVMSILIMCGSFLSMFFFKYVGKWLDTKCIKFMMYMDAISFIVVYTIYGVVVWLIVDNIIPTSTWAVMTIYLMFVLDRLSMQLGVVKAVYLKSIAVDQSEVTKALSTGVSLDHMAAIIAAQISGIIWTTFGAHWVFFLAAFLSLGNLMVAHKLEK